jgi:hypothetical protein
MTDALTTLENWMKSLRMSLTDAALALHGSAVPKAVPPEAPLRQFVQRPPTPRSLAYCDQAAACSTPDVTDLYRSHTPPRSPRPGEVLLFHRQLAVSNACDLRDTVAPVPDILVKAPPFDRTGGLSFDRSCRLARSCGLSPIALALRRFASSETYWRYESAAE